MECAHDVFDVPLVRPVGGQLSLSFFKVDDLFAIQPRFLEESFFLFFIFFSRLDVDLYSPLNGSGSDLKLSSDYGDVSH